MVAIRRPFRDPVLSLQTAEARPKWSVMIPTHNCAHYLRGTLESVLVQDPGTDLMQIAVVDDASVDDPESVVREVSGNRVEFMRHPHNIGHIANFQSCLAGARGHIVHLLHGDDLVCPGFYAALQRGFDAEPTIGAAFCRSVYIDADGHELSIQPIEQSNGGLLVNALTRVATEQRIMTPSIAVRRVAYERLGGFDKRLKCSEDWEMWVRIAANYPFWYEPQPLAAYRMHEKSNTGRHIRSAEDMAYTRMAIRIFANYLPTEIAQDVTGSARSIYASSALETAERLLRSGDRVGTWAQLREAFLLYPSFQIVGQMAKLLLRHGVGLGLAC